MCSIYNSIGTIGTRNPRLRRHNVRARNQEDRNDFAETFAMFGPGGPPLPDDEEGDFPDVEMQSPERQGTTRQRSPDTAPIERQRARRIDFWDAAFEAEFGDAAIDLDFDEELPSYEDNFPNQDEYDSMEGWLNLNRRPNYKEDDLSWAPTYTELLAGIATPTLKKTPGMPEVRPWVPISNPPMMSYPTPVDETKYIDVPHPSLPKHDDGFLAFKARAEETRKRLRGNVEDVDKMLNHHSGTFSSLNNLNIKGEETYKPWYAHGNYMGPNWNDGRYQVSKSNPQSLPVDYGDQQSMYHDNAYASKKNLMWADLVYAKDMLFQGEDVENVTRNTIAGAVVGLQGIGRAVTGMY